MRATSFSPSPPFSPFLTDEVGGYCEKGRLVAAIREWSARTTGIHCCHLLLFPLPPPSSMATSEDKNEQRNHRASFFSSSPLFFPPFFEGGRKTAEQSRPQRPTTSAKECHDGVSSLLPSPLSARWANRNCGDTRPSRHQPHAQQESFTTRLGMIGRRTRAIATRTSLRSDDGWPVPPPFFFFSSILSA